jgi:hypothetical protein
MMKKLKIFLFSDALGYELAQRYRFMQDELPVRLPVRTQLGYSSTAVPTILSGEPPTVHGHFSFFCRTGVTPFRFFKYLHPFLRPRFVFDNHRVRHKLSRLIAKWKKYTGYFNLYRVPYDRLPYFDYCEKKDIYAPGALAPAPNIRDMLGASGVRYHISDWRRGDDENIRKALASIARKEYEFYFIYTGQLDGILHFHVHEPEVVEEAFAALAKQVGKLLETAHQHAEDVAFYLMSDHGMTPRTGVADLRPVLEGAPFRFGRDFLACYDSTMLRLWVLNPEARTPLMERVAGAPGHWLSEDEKKAFNIDFSDNSYGDEIFLLDPGVQLAPSDMGAKAIPGMHGYSPDDPDSTAALLAERPPPFDPVTIADFFRLMRREAEDLRGPGA